MVNPLRAGWKTKEHEIKTTLYTKSRERTWPSYNFRFKNQSARPGYSQEKGRCLPGISADSQLTTSLPAVQSSTMV